MKVKTSVLTLALCFVAGAVCFASDAQMGTWTLNEAKSKLAAGMPKNSTIVLGALPRHIWLRRLSGRLYVNRAVLSPPFLRSKSTAA
jgi:hypothetical protein